MFRFIFFILFIGFLIYGFFNIYWNIQDESNTNESYNSEINSLVAQYANQKEEESEYVIYSQEFLGDRSYDSNNIWTLEPYFSESDFNQRNSQSYENPLYVSSSQVRLPSNKLSVSLWSSPTWRTWTNFNTFQNTSWFDSWLSFTDESCAGIIYDPCLKIWDLDTEGWNFRLIGSGTPIYTDPSQL